LVQKRNMAMCGHVDMFEIQIFIFKIYIYFF